MKRFTVSASCADPNQQSSGAQAESVFEPNRDWDAESLRCCIREKTARCEEACEKGCPLSGVLNCEIRLHQAADDSTNAQDVSIDTKLGDRNTAEN
jgi:hypothetical protein